jgi:hypothetical protein
VRNFRALGRLGQVDKEVSLCQNRACWSPGTIRESARYPSSSPSCVDAATTTESIRNQKMLGRTDATGPIWCQLLEMANVESVDSIASCILRTAGREHQILRRIGHRGTASEIGLS